MKKHTTIIFLVIALVGCQSKLQVSDFVPAEMAVVNDIVTKSSAPKVDSTVTFLTETNFMAWSKIGSLEERFQACDVPESIATRLSTKALVESIAKYPLNYLIFAYDNPLTAVQIIIDYSHLHQELQSRDDAISELTDLYSKSTIITDDNVDSQNSRIVLSYKDEMFLGYLLLFEITTKSIDINSGQILLKVVEDKILEESSQKEIFSDFFMTPLAAIKNFLQNSSLSGYRTPTTTIYTPLGHALEGYLYPEMSQSDIDSLTREFAMQYSDATVLRPASNVYNCHSYAWYSDDTSNNIWLNSHLNPYTSQLHYYWTYDYYEECYEYNATKATYMQSYPLLSHSARIAPSGDYISKWRNGPLMQHSKTDCPYLTTEMHYYKTRYFPSNYINISGTTVVLPGTTNYYSISNIDEEADPYDYDVTASFIVNPSQTPFTFTTINKATQTYSLQCNDYGAYKIRAEYERQPGYLFYGELLVICVGSRTMQRIQDENVTDLERFLRDNWDQISE